MTPEQLRILTTAMANAGAAIGGPGSAGDLIGRGVINQNRRDDLAAQQMKNQIAAEKRAALVGTQWQKAVSSVAKGGPVSGVSPLVEGEGGDLNMLSPTAQNYLEGAKNFEGMLTPNTQIGVTSAAMQPDGTIKYQVTPAEAAANMLSAEQSKSALAAGQKQQLQPSAVQKSESAAALGTPVTIPGGYVVSAQDLGKSKLPNAKIKSYEYLKSLKTPEEKKAFLDVMRASGVNLNIGEQAATAGAIAGAQTAARAEAKFGSSKWLQDLTDTYDKTEAGINYMTTMSSGTPEQQAKATAERNAILNQQIRDQASAEYKGAEQVRPNKKGELWVGYVNEEGKFIPKARLHK